MTAASDLMAAMRATAEAPPVSVIVPGWGRVYVRQPTVEEVDRARTQEEGEDGKELARGACRVICDASGARLFDPTDADHVDLLNKQPWALLQQVIAAARGVKADDTGN